MVFTFFLKDNVHNVIAIENNGIIVTGAFFAFFKHTEQGESARNYAYCYVVKTVSRLYSAPLIYT